MYQLTWSSVNPAAWVWHWGIHTSWGNQDRVMKLVLFLWEDAQYIWCIIAGNSLTSGDIYTRTGTVELQHAGKARRKWTFVSVMKDKMFYDKCVFMEWNQRFKMVDFLMGPWDPWAMILMGPRALGMGPIVDVFIKWKFQDVPQDAGC